MGFGCAILFLSVIVAYGLFKFFYKILQEQRILFLTKSSFFLDERGFFDLQFRVFYALFLF